MMFIIHWYVELKNIKKMFNFKTKQINLTNIFSKDLNQKRKIPIKLFKGFIH
jgi:hypothetical protein